MSRVSQSDVLLVERVRAAEPEAWNELIARFEGRLLAFVATRLRNRTAAEDVVQETLIGFLTSLPNYDVSHPLESYLFSIAAHKLTDSLRREGRRPALPLSTGEDSQSGWDMAGSARPASSIVRSGERRELEAQALVVAIQDQIEYWRQRNDWTKLECIELLMVRGWANKVVAHQLSLTEQQVANYKFDFLEKIRDRIARQGLSIDVFPELYETKT